MLGPCLVAVSLALPATSGAAPSTLSNLTLLPPVGVAARAAWAVGQAEFFWENRGPDVLAQFHTGPYAGQCTDLVAARRSDLVEKVDVWTYAHQVLQEIGRPMVLVVDWTAKAWTGNALAAGIPTGQRAEPGAVMVFQPGAYGAHAAGHVAIVDRVFRNGSFTISEMHAPRIGVISHRHFSARAARAIRHDRRVSFIYGMPAAATVASRAAAAH